MCLQSTALSDGQESSMSSPVRENYGSTPLSSPASSWTSNFSPPFFPTPPTPTSDNGYEATFKMSMPISPESVLVDDSLQYDKSQLTFSSDDSFVIPPTPSPIQTKTGLTLEENDTDRVTRIVNQNRPIPLPRRRLQTTHIPQNQEVQTFEQEPYLIPVPRQSHPVPKPRNLPPIPAPRKNRPTPTPRQISEKGSVSASNEVETGLLETDIDTTCSLERRIEEM